MTEKGCFYCESDELLLTLARLSEAEADSYLQTQDDEFLARVEEAAEIRADQCRSRAESFARAAERIKHVRLLAGSQRMAQST